jgi:hypothetical protein
MGENFVCAVPLEDQAGTTNNLGLGTPFAGNIEVYPVYRMVWHPGTEEMPKSEVRMTKLPTIVRGVLMMSQQLAANGLQPELMDVTGRKVIELHAGANDVSGLAPGVYFIRGAQAQAQAVRRVVIAK